MAMLRSLFNATVGRVWRWIVDRTGLAAVWEATGRHRVPRGTTEGASAWMYVLGFGTLAAFVLQVVTGAILATKYIPAAEYAYESLAFITEDVWFGRLIRGMHFFGASAMVIFMAAHVVRVFLTGSYKFPRELNWMTGVVLFVLVMGMAFTGQLLRWNQDGLWAVVVGSQYVGYLPGIGGVLKRFVLAGETVGGTTLSRFYALHILWLPMLIAAVVGLHLFLVQYHGISEPPKAGDPVDPATYRDRYRKRLEATGRPYWPDAAWKELVVSVAMVIAVLLLALAFGARSLGQPPDPTVVPEDAKPDWYLMWYYALLAIKPASWNEAVMVYLPFAALVVALVLPLVAGRGERSPRKRPWAVGLVLIGLIAFGTLTWLGYRSPWVPDFDTEPVPPEVVGTTRGPAYRGAVLFYTKGCQYCHEAAGYGGEWGPDLTEVTLRLSTGEIAARIINGIGSMPAYRDVLTDEELDALLAFLQALAEEQE